MKYNKNELTPFHQRIAQAYIKDLIADPNTCDILRKKLQAQVIKKKKAKKVSV
jgi:hypothetical protein